MKRIAFVLSFVLVFSLTSFAASNAQNDQLSKKQLAALIASAKTPAEHERIAAYYRAQSERLLAEANDHARMGGVFQVNPATNNEKSKRSTVNHCAYLAQNLKTQSEKARSMAEEHERMAKAAEQK